MNIGRNVFGVGAAALGMVGLVWGDFATVWQPVPAELPGYRGLAYAAAVLLLACGVGLQLKRSASIAACALAALFLAFAVPWAVRVVRFPQLFGTWAGCAEQLALAIAPLSLMAAGKPRQGRLCRIAFGACAIAFGLNHFFALPQTAGMVPSWIPPGQIFWAAATGIFYVSGGVALVTGVLASLAARLLALMIACFGVLIWAPALFAHPESHLVWAGNAINLLATAGAWIIADSISAGKSRDVPAAGGGSDPLLPARRWRPQRQVTDS
jgi:uncharacterized membrane protein YphA (DoxX/SURF4 family)